MIKRTVLLMICILSLAALTCLAEEAVSASGEETATDGEWEIGAVIGGSLEILDGDEDAVREAQRCLSNLGYYSGSADGKYGKRTEKAIRAFQFQCALSETGHLDAYTYSLLKEYSSENINAKTIQQRLIDLGYLRGAADGKFGEKSAGAVKIFQRVNHLDITGNTDAETIIALFSDQAIALPDPLSAGDKGEDVAMLQNDLRRYGFLSEDSDGEYGKSTADAVRAFQEHLNAQGISVDINGDATPLTLYCLYSEDYSSYLRDITPGMADREVERVELRLKALGYLDGDADDTFDDYAGVALRMFQRRADLDFDDVANRRTIDALFAAGAPEAEHCAPHEISSGDSGLAVRDVQNALVAGGFTIDTPDGSFGPALEKALERAADYLGEGDSPTHLTAETVEALQDGPLAFLWYNAASEADALRLQRRLYSLFYLQEDGIDGKVGGGTLSALHDFQAANGLPRSGVDQATTSVLFSADAIAKLYPYRVEVSIDRQVVEVWALNDENGYDLAQTFTCSTGLHDSTPRGVFPNGHPVNRWHYFKKFNCWAQYSFKIVDDIMFHSVIYGSKNENSLRKSSQRNLGSPASHGCVRLSVEDARWLFEHCKRGTVVVVIR